MNSTLEEVPEGSRKGHTSIKKEDQEEQTIQTVRNLPKFSLIVVQMTDYAALRLRGLPFSSKPEDLITFFKEFDIYHDSIKIGRN